MKKSCAVLLVIGLLLTTVPLPGQEVIEEIVAVVNDEIITLTQAKERYELFLQQLLAQELTPEDYDEQRQVLRKELLDIMIQEILLLQKARELDINVGEQLRSIIDNIKKENNLASDDELKRALMQQGITYDAWHKQYEETLLRQAVVYSEVERSIVLDDADVVQYYKQHPDEFKVPEEFHVKVIYLGQEGKDPSELEALRATISGNISSGEEFAALSGRYSDPPFNENQGDLGLVKKGELDRTLEVAVEKLQQGEVSAWIEARNAWYLIKLEEKKESFLQPFEEIRNAVQEKLYLEIQAKKLDEYLATIKEGSYVKILNANPFDY